MHRNGFTKAHHKKEEKIYFSKRHAIIWHTTRGKGKRKKRSTPSSIKQERKNSASAAPVDLNGGVKKGGGSGQNQGSPFADQVCNNKREYEDR